ncbi:hypothetical protein K7395_22170 [Streptomyces filamentosus]|uniref:Integral membrane protein n=2 Tax=Streptomyces filamentosus TaxID=67294 RepID=A0ABY4UZF7_STRFL|nr:MULTISPECIES: hypothetical protein [Streptomyces]EFE75095.1 predicted protein [Streptomyces filamentosus NRRL 15998]EWS92155.1 hypothetical protein SSIG_02648 [Streptomyces filamentosus NRRL 11379]MYR79175.1 hypothetical protein [Streptomyces sp. SID5466]USC49232.1 hypothetical protein K7395_22170 [Streptomyces filamentosus]
MGISFVGAVQLWIPTVLLSAVIALLVRRRRRTPGLMQPPTMAALGLIAFLNAATAWILGFSRAGLDLRESCERRSGVPFDQKWHDTHYMESQGLFPLHAKCSASVDLVPSWVNPTVIALSILSAAFLCTAVCLGVRTFLRRRKKVHV